MSGSEQDGLAGVRGTIEALGDLAHHLPVSADRDGGAPAGVRFTDLADQCSDRIEGAHVLLLGPDGPALAADFAAAGAERVLVRDNWQDLAPAQEGSFDIVYCDRLLHRVLEPVGLLLKLRATLAQEGLLLISSMLLADPERSEYLRFVPTSHAGDQNTWFVPGALAFRWMLHTAGFEVEREFGEREGPREGFPVVYSFVRARPAAPGS